MEYTYETILRDNSIEKIEGLSFDAALHIAKANSIMLNDGRTQFIVWRDYNTGLIEVTRFSNGRIYAKDIVDKE